MKQWEIRGVTTGEAATETPRRTDAKASDEPQVVVDRFPMVFWTTDAELGFTSSPAPGVLHLGLSPDRFAGRSLFDLFGPDETGLEVINAHLRALRGKVATFRLPGRGRQFHCWVSPLQGPAGRPIGTICVGLDDSPGEEPDMFRFRTPYLQVV